MNPTPQIVPATERRRYIATFINFMLLGVVTFSIQEEIKNEFISQNWMFISFPAWIIIFTLFPESPGMRMLSLKQTSINGEEINRTKRIKRNSFLILPMLLVPTLSLSPIMNDLYLPYYTAHLALAFYAMNFLKLWLGKDGISIIDRLTNTRVYQIKPPVGTLKTY